MVIAYDDSDGWYDHQMGPILTESQTSLDTLSAPGQCGSDATKRPQQAKLMAVAGREAAAGYDISRFSLLKMP